MVGDPALPAYPSRAPPVRFSRFPGSWEETATQVSRAVVHAALEGHDRIRVDVKRPELLVDEFPDPLRKDVPLLDTSPHACRVALLTQAACDTIGALIKLDHSDKRNYRLCVKPRRAAVHFNSREDAVVGDRFISDEVRQFTDVFVLGEKKKDRPKADVAVMIAPTNRQGNFAQIEKVELVHYANWSAPKINVMFNPQLIALTSLTAFGDEPREPGFLRDYLRSYYLDPAAFPSKTATGAVLRCFPRKWEMYLLKVKSKMGFRLVAEQPAPPSPEKIRGEFSWRIESEMETAVSF